MDNNDIAVMFLPGNISVDNNGGHQYDNNVKSKYVIMGSGKIVKSMTPAVM